MAVSCGLKLPVNVSHSAVVEDPFWKVSVVISDLSPHAVHPCIMGYFTASTVGIPHVED